MKMNPNSAENSPPLSENVNGSWTAGWDHVDDASINHELHLENSSQLQSLVVDKELAARAVAFVVSSSRKGIVPLCADVANLLKAKSRLEQKVSRLRRENEALRSSVSLHTSNCTSPLPTSAYSDRSSSYGGHHHTGKGSPTYSSSQCSSLAGSSHKLDKFPSPAPLPAFSFPPLPSSDHSVMSEGSDDALVLRHERYKRHERKNSLPEMIAHPHDSIPKISPRGQAISAEVQCSLGPDGDAAHEMNLTLRRDLTNAQQEIEALRQKLLSIELKQKSLDECYVENECAKNRNVSTEIARVRCSSPTLIPPPLEGCKCRACEGANCDVALKGGFSCDKTLLCARVQIALNDTVRLVDGQEGRVCYLGHVDKLGSANAIFLGVETVNPASKHDGSHLGERYFTCKHNSGLFAPVEDVDLIISNRTGKPISRSLSSRKEKRNAQRKSSFCLSKTTSMETNEVV